ncbi:Uncharacterized conserved protein, DUF849 family [Devosia enhydra]|uniref:Uncharacterized conserved protein, DUF849 family n=2 Tax=Devosia enhydra TaxID=665118 RepID=A0A1K2HY94_9HYPH|nr:Uncharacterized conserved protein, DUF849 family [Devosia enhydra]
MVAPNGARRLKSDHPNLPMSIAETIACLVACRAEGADAAHVHVRDGLGGHWLDAGAYRELLAEARDRVPGMVVQVTSEAAGRYAPEAQMAMLRALLPPFASCAVRELALDLPAAIGFYREMAEAGVAIQHIVYGPGDLLRLDALLAGLPPARPAILCVAGAYEGRDAGPRELVDFVSALGRRDAEIMLCAFGATETRLLGAALALGLHVRVGFENGLVMADGTLAEDNAGRVAEIAALRQRLGLDSAERFTARALGAEAIDARP